MNNQEMKKENIKDAILHKINTKELSMRPRSYFTLKIVATAMIALSVLLISVFILNFMLFSIRINSHDALLSFGPRGWGAFLHFFPWLLLVLDIAFIVILERMIRHFRFGYKIPSLYLFGGLLLSACLLGFVVDRGTDVNDRLLLQSEQHREHPPFFGIYGAARHAVPPSSGICLCTIQSIADDTLVVQDTRSTTTLTLAFDDEVSTATSTGLNVGDAVFVAGEVKDGVITVFGIKKVPHGGPMNGLR